jgi:GWxTD domain-containing protein
MWKVLVACAVIAISLQAAPRDPDERGMRSEGMGPQFRCQLGQRLGVERDSLHLIAAISIPYDNLIFLRSDSGFSASFEIVTSIFRDGSGLYAERITPQDASTMMFAETNSRVRNAVHVEEFIVPSGDYRVRVELTVDKESKRKSKWEGKISLPPADPLLRLSDIYWVSEDVTQAELGMPRLVEGFPTNEPEARARVQLYSSGPHDIHLMWMVLNEKNDTVRAQTDTTRPTETIQTHEYSLEIRGLPPERYVLQIEAEGNGRREVRTRQFTVRIPGVPLSVTDFDLAVRQMKYIASSAEWNEFRSAMPQERERLFNAFWKKRDPTPDTEENELLEEYFRRVEYANEKFATHRPGWETDRGRIYIMYGEPTDIERHPFESDSRPYEIWFYSQIARKFVFVDYTGFGDYTLVGPEWGY